MGHPDCGASLLPTYGCVVAARDTGWFLGAPNLTDAIWLYGGSYDKLLETVTYSRYGVMPSWTERLSEAELRAVATYVHGLGGGEAAE